MFKVSKRMEISAMHKLDLDYESQCKNAHGHNWIITVEIEGPRLNRNGMLIDFTVIKEIIHRRLDHKNLNDIFDFNPTAENIADWVAKTINSYLDSMGPLFAYCSKVTVQETEGNYAEWRRD